MAINRQGATAMGRKSEDRRLAEDNEAAALRLAQAGDAEGARAFLELARAMHEIDREGGDLALSRAERRLAARRERERLLAERDAARRARLDGLPPGWRSAEDAAPVAPGKTRVTLRLDDDVLAWFRRLGPGYQTRINAVLRAYREAKRDKAI